MKANAARPDRTGPRVPVNFDDATDRGIRKARRIPSSIDLRDGQLTVNCLLPTASLTVANAKTVNSLTQTLDGVESFDAT